MIEVNTVADYRAYTENGNKHEGYEKYSADFGEVTKGNSLVEEKKDSVSDSKTETNREGLSFSGVDMELYNYSGEKLTVNKFSGRMIDIAI